jgi:uncharacterized membrane protein YfcA
MAVFIMTDFFLALAVGTILGFLAGLGTGGGSLLILWLTLVLQMPHNLAGTVNLMFFLPSALVACLFRFKQGKLDIKRTLPALMAGCVGAVVFSYLQGKINAEILRKPFGILLLLTGIRELFYRPRNAK